MLPDTLNFHSLVRAVSKVNVN